VLRTSCSQILSHTWKSVSLLSSKVSNRVVWKKRTFQTRLQFVPWKGWQHIPPKRWHLSTNIFMQCPFNVFPAIFPISPLFWERMPELNNKSLPLWTWISFANNPEFSKTGLQESVGLQLLRTLVCDKSKWMWFRQHEWHNP